ncbi:MAG: hypothetical protein AAGL96_12965 [Pseudomonadota bacterium]
MLRNIFMAALTVGSLCAGATHAQEGGGKISLELNKATATEDGKCQVVFYARNGLDQVLDEISLRVAFFDAEGVFKNLLALSLGSLDVGKRRVLLFNLPGGCAELSEIVVNDVAACKVAGSGGNDSDVCLSELTVTSRTEIAFGL